MTSKDYLASISQNPGIRHDEIHTEILLNSSHTKDILLAKHMVEEDLCEKRTIITVVLQNYKEEVLDILGSRTHYHTKASSIDTLLETKVIPELLSKDVFTSTCSAPYEQVFLSILSYIVTIFPYHFFSSFSLQRKSTFSIMI